MHNIINKYIVFIVSIIVFIFPYHINAKTITISTDINTSKELSTLKSHDVKFILESSLSSADWNPGVSKIVGTNDVLLNYDTEGLKLYLLKSKINIFDTDVLELEKYGTFEKGNKQEKLLKQRKYNDDSIVDGLNISLHAFLIFKYFYLYNYNFLDDIEYQYDYYNFYAKAVNNLDAIYWWGKTNDGYNLQDYVRLPKGSLIELTTEFNEHRLYLVDLKSYLKKFYIDSFKIGLFSTYWTKESFVGITAENGTIPVIQSVLLESEGISLLLKHTINKLNIDLKFRYNYGLNSFVVVSNTHYNSNYTSIDILVDYQYNIHDTSKYSTFAKAHAIYSAKWFDTNKYTINTDTMLSIGFSLGIMF